MKLHSNFHDYYDSAIGLGVDPTIHFNRVTKTVKPDREFRYEIPASFRTWHHNARPVIIGFCGHIFPLLIVEKISGQTVVEQDFYYSLPEVPFEAIHLGKWEENRLKMYFLGLNDRHEDETFLRLETPIWVAWRRDWSVCLQINPCLQSMMFYRIKDSFAAFQEISSYLSNLLVPKNEPLQIEDKYRIEQHGFDRKTSFRKAKSK